MAPIRLRSVSAALCLLNIASVAVAQSAYSTWKEYGGTPDSAQFSSLTQVNRGNVTQLQVAWHHSTGDGGHYMFNPMVVGRTMYVLAEHNSIVALDATNGKELWRHELDAKSGLVPRRGLNYWRSKDGSEERLIFAVNNQLQEIDAKTGKSITDFGKVDLRDGLGRDPKSLTLVQSTTPGRVFEDLIILGSATNEEYASGPGDIRAFNVRTGKLAWVFHTIPHPGEPGYETWPKDAWKTVGGANAWSGISIDEKRGIVFVPTASPKYNFYGADRLGANLFGDCLLALDARTGKLIWYYQMVHHDIWDYDNGTAPMLMTIHHDGKAQDIVAQANKEGFVWAFDRVTGKPVWPIVEKKVPKSDMPGEVTWPTQPFPTKPAPFARQSFTSKDLNPYLDAAERDELKKQIDAAHNEGLFTPPGLGNTVEMPGNNGGANFGGAAIDPATGTLYVVSKDLPAMLKLELNETVEAAAGASIEARGRAQYENTCALCHGPNRAGQPPAIPSLVGVTDRLSADQIRSTVKHGQGQMPAFGNLPDAQVDAVIAYLRKPELAAGAAMKAEAPKTQVNPLDAHYRSSFGFMFTSTGLPAIAPPWTTLTAYDMNRGVMKWQVPLGEVPELAAEGHHDTGSHFPRVAPVVTAGGLIFAGTRDAKVRALDSATGKVIWESTVSAAVEGMPSVYEVDGVEYVAFCAAAQATTHTHDVPGHKAENGPTQSEYVVFALPKR